MKVNIGKYGRIDRKVNIRIDDSDVFSLDHTLAYIILPSLILLKECKSGVPGEFATVGGEDYDQQYSFDFYSENVNELFDEHATKRWEDILDKMIWSFQQMLDDDWENQYYYGKTDYQTKEADETCLNPITNKVVKVYTWEDMNPNGHWTDFEGLRIHGERIQEGLELFGKYLRHLWT